MRNALSVVLIILAAAGCKVGPDYRRPSATGTNAIPAAFENYGQTNGVSWSLAKPAADLPKGAWWRVFNDSTLDDLEAQANSQNQQLAASVARYQQAVASVKIARSDLFPQVQAAPSFSRQRTSFNAPQNGIAATNSHTYNTFNLSLETGWEADLWGRVRRQVESARDLLAASRDDEEALKLSIQAEVANNYFSLRSIESELDVLRRTVETYTKSLALTRNRRKGGVASDLDVSQAETQLRSAESQIPALGLQRERLLHSIAVLCGKPATGFRVVESSNPSLTTAPAIPPSQPSELLQRRPDIAAAERRMASANAQVGVAQTAFYPRLTINGLAGFQSISASTLFDWPSRVWAVGPTLELPIFTGGRNHAQLEQARAAYNETVANYRQVALSAFQEVEDQLAAQNFLSAQIDAEAAALASATRTLDIANNRYKAGLVTYLEVASAQAAALDLERTNVQLRAQRLLAAVSLIKALGGGWQ